MHKPKEIGSIVLLHLCFYYYKQKETRGAGKGRGAHGNWSIIGEDAGLKLMV